MLEHMRESRTAHDFVARAYLVPDLNRSHRGVRHFDQQHFHAVGEDVLVGVGPHRDGVVSQDQEHPCQAGKPRACNNRPDHNGR